MVEQNDFVSHPKSVTVIKMNSDSRGICLAAQREIPPHIAQYLFEIVSQKGVSHPFCLDSCGIAQVSLRYP